MFEKQELAEIGVKFDGEGEPYNEGAAKLAAKLTAVAQKIGRIVEMPELLGRERVTDALLAILSELQLRPR